MVVSLSLSVCIIFYPPFCLSLCLCLPVFCLRLHGCLSVSLPVCLILSLPLSLSLFVWLSAPPKSVYLPVCLTV